MSLLQTLTESVWVASAVAFIGSLLLMPLVIRLAHRQGWVAQPKADRWHERPTALMGGIGIFFAATLAFVFVSGSINVLPVWLGAAIMFATGFVDDLKNIKPASKLISQIIATGLLLIGGFAFGPQFPVWFSVPLTFFWVVGITNALNLLDNMDGLAAGIAAIASIFLAWISWVAGNPVATATALAVAGSAAGFLFYNFKPAKIFMGDSGSLFLGYMIASLSIMIQRDIPASQGFAVYLVSAAVLAVPIFDTTLVTMMRPAAGRSVSQGGRDHTSHRLVFLGLSERRAVVFLYGISIVSGIVGLVFYISDIHLFYSLLIFMVVALVSLGVFLADANVYDDAPRQDVKESRVLSRGMELINQTLGTGWKAIFAVFADLALVVAAYILAFFLRFEQGMSPDHEMFISRALPILIAVKLPMFYLAGLYRSVWRYAGAPELVRIVCATVFATLAAFIVLGLTFGFSRISLGVTVIDWMIVTISVAGLRFGFRALPQFMMAQRNTGRRVLLYGAGSAGMLALMEIRNNQGLGLNAVGFVDDNVVKVGRIFQGLPVLSTGIDLEKTCEHAGIDEVIIATFHMSEDRVEEVYARCKGMGIRCRSLNVSFVSEKGSQTIPLFVERRVAHAS